MVLSNSLNPSQLHSPPAMASLTPSKATPKRKRDEDTAFTSPVKFSFDISNPELTKDGSASPQSKVAHRFRGLALESGGGVLNDDDVHGSPQSRKRQKPGQFVNDAEATEDQILDSSPCPSLRSSPFVGFKTRAATADRPLTPNPSDGKDAMAPEQGFAPCEETTSPKPRHGELPTLPLTASAQNDEDSEGTEDEDDVVDPVRAALTWREDEITIYDPNDEDDDGTGINGIGFKPTPALAHARALRRRQQMAEYRKREEGDARARRSQRRSGDIVLSAQSKKKSTARRVRFIDTERHNMVVTTQ